MRTQATGRAEMRRDDQLTLGLVRGDRSMGAVYLRV